MAAAHRGAKAAGEATIAIVPGESRRGESVGGHVVLTRIEARTRSRRGSLGRGGDRRRLGNELPRIAFAMRLGRWWWFSRAVRRRSGRSSSAHAGRGGRGLPGHAWPAGRARTATATVLRFVFRPGDGGQDGGIRHRQAGAAVTSPDSSTTRPSAHAATGWKMPAPRRGHARRGHRARVAPPVRHGRVSRRFRDSAQSPDGVGDHCDIPLIGEKPMVDGRSSRRIARSPSPTRPSTPVLAIRDAGRLEAVEFGAAR